MILKKQLEIIKIKCFKMDRPFVHQSVQGVFYWGFSVTWRQVNGRWWTDQVVELSFYNPIVFVSRFFHSFFLKTHFFIHSPPLTRQRDR
jgi:hypothetical protein